MRRIFPIIQAVIIALGVCLIPNAPTSADPQCYAVAETAKKMESIIATAWSEKNAGGQEELARSSAQSLVATFGDMPHNTFSCMDAKGRIRFMAVISKAVLLLAVLEQSSEKIKRSNIPLAIEVVAIASKYKTINPIYWRAINEDLAKVKRRYSEVARAEANAARAQREAAFSVTHPHESRSDANRLATMDAKTTTSRSKASKLSQVASARCARPNVPATTIHAVEPDTPQTAQEQGLSGDVAVIVSLDAQSRVVGARIQSSPSSLLNSAALIAAYASTFQTEIQNCKPITADYIYTVQFSSQ